MDITNHKWFNFIPSHVLIVDKNAEAIHQELSSKTKNIKFRVRESGEVSRSDWNWADGYIGFLQSANLSNGLKWIHSTGAGVDRFLSTNEWPSHVLLTRTVGNLGRKLGEYCITRALLWSQNFLQLQAAQQDRLWKQISPAPLWGSNVLILGTGDMGRGIASAFRALGCRVSGASKSGKPSPLFDSVFRLSDVDQALSVARWIIVALPLTPETNKIVSEDFFAGCRSAYLINVGRGAVVDNLALIRSIEQGCISGAALDVFETEPLPKDSNLWNHPKILVSPHIAALTDPMDASNSFLDSLSSLNKNIKPRLVVDPVKGY